MWRKIAVEEKVKMEAEEEEEGIKTPNSAIIDNALHHVTQM